MFREKGTKMAKSQTAGKRAAGVRKAQDKVTAELGKTKAAAENGESRTS
ncbi:hypothetical protein SNOG_10042 [Parastagonospora nodorum SN15]|uniref:Uncharacterized protein n=1 Tax=Phaeosphaeria nodorum (strain SN15 / ATCC MYA-4574 / FGSC 10173) TaxID=321614 RepID=Q0UDX2_PHANO|nr:hypothetical protein SNOG_10042 [Parastagonospora nodorum SN15]EAT82377.1 hypothetical protein SNOG_10042 [Parastagonospora nodorum SN15]